MKRDFTVGVFTTDTHQTNMVRGVLNPLKEQENTLETIREAVREAVSDMQEAKYFSDRRWFDIRVLGAKQSIEVISTVNSIVAVAKITLPPGLHRRDPPPHSDRDAARLIGPILIYTSIDILQQE